MAEMTMDGLDGLITSLEEIRDVQQAIGEKMLNEMADALVPEIVQRGHAYGVGEINGTGELLNSIRKGKVRLNKYKMSIDVKPYGTRVRKKQRISNAEIGFHVNYGTKLNQALPFFSDTVELSQKTVSAAGERVLNDWLNSKNL